MCNLKLLLLPLGVIIVVLLALAACSGNTVNTVQLYDDPARPDKDIAIVRRVYSSEEGLRIFRIKGPNIDLYGDDGSKYARATELRLLPGEYSFTVKYFKKGQTFYSVGTTYKYDAKSDKYVERPEIYSGEKGRLTSKYPTTITRNVEAGKVYILKAIVNKEKNKWKPVIEELRY